MIERENAVSVFLVVVVMLIHKCFTYYIVRSESRALTKGAGFIFHEP
jgi:hypothetical protein